MSCTAFELSLTSVIPRKWKAKDSPLPPMPLLPYPSIFYFFCAHRNSKIPKQVPLSCEVQASQRKSADEFDNEDLIYNTGCVEVSRINYSPTTRKTKDTTRSIWGLTCCTSVCVRPGGQTNYFWQFLFPKSIEKFVNIWGYSWQYTARDSCVIFHM